MEPDPIYEKSILLPFGYSFTARARPSTMRRTALKLLPWALYAALPGGRISKIALGAARRFSPPVKQRIRR